jgi:drug/metabolite transporter (DMT)-like permease
MVSQVDKAREQLFSPRARGIQAALSSALFLGLAPVFGKQAILLNVPPLAVVSLRTVLAAALMLVMMAVFHRRFFYIYPAGLLGCFLAGGINGLGSLLYYSSLGRIDVSLGQLLYALYPIFLALWLRLDNQPLSRLTILRLLIAIPALYLLTRSGSNQVDLLGVGMMLASSALYALHLPINQRVLYDMPAPTVTLYTLISMSAVVVPAFYAWQGLSGTPLMIPENAWTAIAGLTIVTFLSRLALFFGVKNLGGMQTALLGLGEILAALVFSHLLLHESFSPLQWLGMVLLAGNLMLVGLEKNTPMRFQPGGWLSWLKPPGIPADVPGRPTSG